MRVRNRVDLLKVQEDVRKRVEVLSTAVIYTHTPRDLGMSEVSPRLLLERYRELVKGSEGLEKQELAKRSEGLEEQEWGRV